MQSEQRSRWFRRIWFGLIAIAGALELATLLRGRSGETMSSYVRAKVQHPVLRGLLGGLLGWLLYHWLAAETTQLSWRDGASTAVGVVIGLMASRTHLR